MLILFTSHSKNQDFFSCIFLIYIIFFSPGCFCLEPISTVTALGAAALGALYTGYLYTNCRDNECCDDNWVRYDYSGLQQSLKNKLFGQHLAAKIVPKMLNGHLNNKNPQKALVMSFHGSTGNGKNYITQLIVENLYKNASDSRFVHLYVANQHFPDEKKVAEYQELLRNDIVAYTKLCGRSLFIFDEVHQMPVGVLDAIKPFIDYHQKIDGIDYRKNIFIFLSNAGANAIKGVALKAWADGKDREDIVMKDIEPLLNKETFKGKGGGFKFSQIVQNELIDVYVPFLPLERKHVEQCIQSELKAQKKRFSQQTIADVADEMVYFPPELSIFSESGCKKISQKVSLCD